MAAKDKPLVWLRGKVKTPPFTFSARIEAGVLLRRLQQGERLSLPYSRHRALDGAATNYESKIKIRVGGLFIESRPMPYWFLRFFARRRNKLRHE